MARPKENREIMTERISFLLLSDMREKLARLAHDKHITVSEYIRKCLEDRLKKIKD